MKLIFWALPSHFKDPILTKFSMPQADFWKKKQTKKAFLDTFVNFWPKTAVSRRALPPQNWILLAPTAPSKKLLGQPAKIGYLKTVQSRTLWVGRESNCWGGRTPLNPLVIICTSIILVIGVLLFRGQSKTNCLFRLPFNVYEAVNWFRSN